MAETGIPAHLHDVIARLARELPDDERQVLLAAFEHATPSTTVLELLTNIFVRSGAAPAEAMANAQAVLAEPPMDIHRAMN